MTPTTPHLEQTDHQIDHAARAGDLLAEALRRQAPAGPFVLRLTESQNLIGAAQAHAALAAVADQRAAREAAARDELTTAGRPLDAETIAEWAGVTRAEAIRQAMTYRAGQGARDLVIETLDREVVAAVAAAEECATDHVSRFDRDALREALEALDIADSVEQSEIDAAREVDAELDRDLAEAHAAGMGDAGITLTHLGGIPLPHPLPVTIGDGVIGPRAAAEIERLREHPPIDYRPTIATDAVGPALPAWNLTDGGVEVAPATPPLDPEVVAAALAGHRGDVDAHRADDPGHYEDEADATGAGTDREGDR